MSIQSEAERIKANVAATYAAAAGLGAEMPGAQNSDNLSKTVAGAKAVLYAPQELTAEQQAQARSNIGALAETELDAAVDDALAQAKESGDFKGEKGDTGAAGANGVSATHSWNGATLTIMSASGTSSANLKGDKGDKGDTGGTGPAGYTPVRGTDYFTDEDQAKIVQDVLNALPVWTGGNF